MLTLICRVKVFKHLFFLKKTPTLHSHQRAAHYSWKQRAQCRAPVLIHLAPVVVSDLYLSVSHYCQPGYLMRPITHTCPPVCNPQPHIGPCRK